MSTRFQIAAIVFLIVQSAAFGALLRRSPERPARRTMRLLALDDGCERLRSRPDALDDRHGCAPSSLAVLAGAIWRRWLKALPDAGNATFPSCSRFTSTWRARPCRFASRSPVYLMVQAVLFGIGAVLVSATPLANTAMTLMPWVIIGTAVLSALISWRRAAPAGLDSGVNAGFRATPFY
ncbi:MAG: hypothetical protein U1E30_03245 [Rhodoblastus sp.]